MRSADDASLVDVLLEQQRLMLEREDRMREEMEAKSIAQIEKLREELTPKPPPEAISEQQLGALQSRLDAVHAAELLSEEEMFALEDAVADFLEARAEAELVGARMGVHSHPAVGKLHKLVALSESLQADGAFARQARRKYV